MSAQEPLGRQVATSDIECDGCGARIQPGDGFFAHPERGTLGETCCGAGLGEILPALPGAPEQPPPVRGEPAQPEERWPPLTREALDVLRAVADGGDETLAGRARAALLTLAPRLRIILEVTVRGFVADDAEAVGENLAHQLFTQNTDGSIERIAWPNGELAAGSDEVVESVGREDDEEAEEDGD